jgi:hypothetical protein
VASVLAQHVVLSESTMIVFFKHAFPEIPLRTLREAGGWHRLCEQGFSDREFDARLGQWLPTP